MTSHVAKVLLGVSRIRGTQSLRVASSFVRRGLQDEARARTLKYLIFQPRPSEVSSFHCSYSGIVKNEISFLFFET